MILVTIGTTMPFDELIEEVDRLAKVDFFEEEVICQIGSTVYVPEACKYFKYKPGLEEFIASASFLIIHGGTGSVIEALLSAKPFAAFANPRAADDHQGEFLSRMEREFNIAWSRNCSDLKSLYLKARGRKENRQPRSSESRRLCDAVLSLCRGL